jgi:uncharacterized protein involved in exopolysaccharide biosynthesis
VTGTVDAPGQEISLLAIWQFMWRNTLIFAFCFLVCAAAAAAVSYLVTPRFRAEITFSPANNSENFGQLSGELGSLAAIAGINVGGAGQKSEEALAYLRSRGFTAEFIQKHSLLPILYAKQWDAQRGQWNVGVDPPTLSAAVKRFSNIREISEDRRTGIVTLSIVWSDRVLAAQWANALIAEADTALRQRGVAELGRSIQYLKDESAQIPDVEIRAAVYKVMESELKDQMLARTRDAYAFEVLDPAVPPDPKDKDSPNRILYVVVGGAFGLLIGSAWGLARRRGSGRAR